MSWPSILSHLLAIRARSVPLGLFLDTCESLLDDGEWFIRKAVGWGLRELSTRYPQETFDFLMQHRERASRLTLREGARKLPADLQRQVLE
jgi:3-methyladenine DNA glycosylase AlkD